MTEPTFTICESSGKRRYLDELDARIVLSRVAYLAVASKQRKHEREVYQCLECGGGWHLTSVLTREIREVVA
jgi:hypothetical protein